MAKNKTQSQTNSADESTALVEFQVTIAEPTLLPPTVNADLIVKHGLDNNPFNQWTPNVDESRILFFRGVKKIHIESQDIDGLLCRFLDARTGEVLFKFLGEYIIKEFVENKIHETGLPVLLTYRGKIRGRKREGQEIHNWSRYYYNQDEWSKLTGAR